MDWYELQSTRDQCAPAWTLFEAEILHLVLSATGRYLILSGCFINLLFYLTSLSLIFLIIVNLSRKGNITFSTRISSCHKSLKALILNHAIRRLVAVREHDRPTKVLSVMIYLPADRCACAPTSSLVIFNVLTRLSPSIKSYIKGT